jgi:hypothetical protein
LGAVKAASDSAFSLGGRGGSGGGGPAAAAAGAASLEPVLALSPSPPAGPRPGNSPRRPLVSRGDREMSQSRLKLQLHAQK